MDYDQIFSEKENTPLQIKINTMKMGVPLILINDPNTIEKFQENFKICCKYGFIEKIQQCLKCELPKGFDTKYLLTRTNDYGGF